MARDDEPGEGQRVIEETATHVSPAGPSKSEILPRTSKTWGPLELRRTIGQGRFGTVYVAWDPGLEREVALKILHEADQSAAVIQEARLLARVRHPNVVTVYDRQMADVFAVQEEIAQNVVDRLKVTGRAPFYLGVLGHYYARSGAAEKVRQVLEELDRLEGHRYVPPHCFAYIHAGLNDLDRALDWEAKAYDDGASPFNYYSPLIENLHADPRHTAELRRMRLREWTKGS